MTDPSDPTRIEQPGPSRPPTPWLVLALPLVMVGLILLFSPNFQQIEGMRPGPFGGDFLQEWVGARLFLTEQQTHLYDLSYVQTLQHDPELVGFEWPAEDYFPMVYPPFYYAFLQPLSELAYPVAARIWVLVSALAFSFSGFLMFRFYQPCQRVFRVCFASTVIFVPLLNCFNMGQKSTFLLLILTGTFVLLHHKRCFLAGLVFGLIVFKPHLGIVIGLAMLLKGQWQFALGAIVVVVAAFGYSWVDHSALVIDYLQLVARLGNYVQTGGYNLADSHSLWGASQLTLGWLPSILVKWIAAALSLLVVRILWVNLRGPIDVASAGFSKQFAALVLAMALLSPHFYNYDLTILLLPMLLVVSSFPEGQWRATNHDRALGFLLLGIFVMAGLFGQIADVIRVQPSLFLTTAALVLLGISRSKAS